MHMLKMRYPLRSGYQHVFDELKSDPDTNWTAEHWKLWAVMRGNADAVTPLQGNVKVALPVSALTPALWLL